MTTYIIIITCVISFLAFQSDEMKSRMIFNPYLIHTDRQWYRFITAGLIHADWIHLLVNMYVLYFFGNYVEAYFRGIFEEKATGYFLLLYMGGMMMSVLPTFGKYKDNPGYNALGASGAVSSVVFAFILLNPLEKIYLFGSPILGLPAIIFGVAYLIYCVYASKRGRDNVNHDAHFWGALYGFFLTVLLKPSLIAAFFSQLIYFRNSI